MTVLQVMEVVMIISLYDVFKTVLRAVLDFIDDEKNRDEENEVLDEVKAEIEDHCGLVKENHCRFCSYCNSVMGVREILEIIDNYKMNVLQQG